MRGGFGSFLRCPERFAEFLLEVEIDPHGLPDGLPTGLNTELIQNGMLS